MEAGRAPAADRYVLGIDAGGTKTMCLLADGRGRIVGEARGPGANLQAAGELEVEKVLHEVMERAIGDREPLPSAICVGMAGVDREGDAALLHVLMRRIGYKARIVITNDALIALVAGVADEPGVVLIAGTGSIAYGRNRRNEAARAGGWGYVLGDEGSGYWIGRHALRAVVRESDGRGPRTALTPLVLEHYGATHASGLVHAIYDCAVRPQAIAAVARAVQRAADEGDEVAAGILAVGARELAACAASVVRRLGLTDERFTFVLAGGILQAVPRLTEGVEARLLELAPQSRIERLTREPATGAVTLALAELGAGARIPAYKAS
jgi:N-acetylglucosamine kinase-like BadF-type ATPase